MAFSQGALALDQVTPPSQPQIALALAIVKQKPTEIDLKEYLPQIRQYIKTTRDFCRATSQDKFFDSVSFWQQAYEKSEAEQSKLLDRIYELEQRNAALATKIKPRDAAASLEEELGPLSSKRKTASKSSVNRKRAKTQVSTGANHNNSSQMRSDNLSNGIEDLEGVTTSFMRNFFSLQKVLQKRPSCSNIVLAAVALCEATAKELLNAVDQNQVKDSTCRLKPARTVLRTEIPDFTSVLHGVEIAIGLLYQALNKLSGTGGKRDLGQVTYHLVRLFDDTMVVLQKHCKARTNKSTATSKAGTKYQRTKQSAKSKHSKMSRPVEAHLSTTGDDVSMHITRLLSTMALSLDPSSAEHRDLLEGFLFILLSRVGKLLCLFVFRDLRLHPDLKVNTAKLPLPEGLIEADMSEVSLHSAQLEAKHLVWLLERVLAFLDTVPSLPSSPSQKQALNGEFILGIKEKLQSTLLQAVFGANDPLFQQSLKYPARPESSELDRLRKCVQVPEQSVPDWFTQEVWRLLGWDILVKNDHFKG
ncbi:hypothetical protein MPDQ_003288 [Monascus purpureus]|uniref:Uncharacterized protein n=1 Tax=Monascus purpureus TaxID=5098 RepID=A0A507QZ68_MONPU|nr:hypothetical protein MPDQ_003288 [Monascus purpureus]BDD55910.1 hypothetical protein MAP00_001392 [Monascus purpureus]